MTSRSTKIAAALVLLPALGVLSATLTRGQEGPAHPPAPPPAPAAPAPDAPAPAGSATPASRPRLTLADIEDAFLDVADRVRPGVVAIEAKHDGEEDLDIARNVCFSGVVWDDTGTIVAIGRDLESATEIAVSPYQGEALEARFLGLDDETGVAVLKVDGDRKGLRVLEHGRTEELRAGCFCVAVGNPAGLRHSVAFGHVAATGRTVKRGSFVTKDAIQITLSVNPGDPGGLLADSHGRLVGVLSSSLRRPETLKFERDIFELARRLFERAQGRGDGPPAPKKGDGGEPEAVPGPGLERLGGAMRRAMEGGAGFAQNVGFALPVEEVAKAVERVERSLGKPWLGVDVVPLDDEDRTELGIPGNRGILVVGVRAGSPAARASLKPNDVVLSWNGTPVTDVHELRKFVLATTLGADVKLEVLRGKETVTLAVRIEGRR